MTERQIEEELDKANQIAALAAAVAVKQILICIDIKGRPSLWVQGTESHELEPLTRWPTDPILLSQEIEQRKSSFEWFEILAHGAVFASGDQPKKKGAAFPGKDGGGARNFSETQRPEHLQKGSHPR